MIPTYRLFALWYFAGVACGMAATGMILEHRFADAAALQAEARQNVVLTQSNLKFYERLHREAEEDDKVSAQCRWQNERDRRELKRAINSAIERRERGEGEK